ncbi:hypothetical protein F52700_4569 [Fusarium sp. NRRL 52700]|nr:hypothetical protein F52700_4569 [Fusarium sp. NRRL 52700]
MATNLDKLSKETLTSIANVSAKVRDAISASLPIGQEQYLTITVPATVIDLTDSDHGGLFVYDESQHRFPPANVRHAEASLVDRMMPIAKLAVCRTPSHPNLRADTAKVGNETKSVARSYARALDMLIPTSPTSNPSGEMDYAKSMEFLKQKVQGTSKTIMEVYQDKEMNWIKQREMWETAKIQVHRRAQEAFEDGTEDYGEKRQRYVEKWATKEGKRYRYAIQAAWMEWVDEGKKYAVEFALGIFQKDSMERVESSKEAMRNSAIDDTSGDAEVYGVSLTPKTWATSCKVKAEEWRGQLNGSDETGWSKITLSYSASDITNESGTTGFGIWTLGDAGLPEELRREMASCDVVISLSALVVDIYRPWLHSELFSNTDLDAPRGVKVSPGPSRIHEMIKDQEDEQSGEWAFPAYPTSFIIAADTTIEFIGETRAIEEFWRVGGEVVGFLKAQILTVPLVVLGDSFWAASVCVNFLQRLLRGSAFLFRLLMVNFINSFPSDFSSGKMKRITRAARAAEMNPQSPGDQRTHRAHRRQLITSIVQPAPIQQIPPQQAPARRAAPFPPNTKVQYLAYAIQDCHSSQQASEKFACGLEMVAENTADMASILSGIMNYCHDRVTLYHQATMEAARLQSGHWDGHFRMVAANIQWLTDNWGGPNWLPADIRDGLERSCGNPVPSCHVKYLVSITQAAQANAMDLDCLWAEGGVLRTAIGDDGQQCLSLSLKQNIICLINNARARIGSEASDQSRQSSTALQLESGSERSSDIKVEMSALTEPIPIQADPINEILTADDNNNFAATVDAPSAHEHVAQTQAQPTNDGAQSGPPATRKRTFEQMNNTDDSMYDKYKTLMTSAKPERIAQLRAEAMEKLEQAESEKVATDRALVTLRAREDQLRQFRDHSKRMIDTTSNGLREQANHDVLAGTLANMGDIYFNGVNRLLDSFLQTSSAHLGGLTVEELQARHNEAADRVDKAKKHIRALDHIEKARAVHENYIEMNEFRESMRLVWVKTGERVEDLEKACVAAFSHAEEED